ncbi:hypothetical protein BDN71DRAFT_1449628 [Pleurotus eryngii]|uniref:Uncharacterized protein n=1 Tax=Pleurotus eryngii TaxID=5323 RepID=A0A9P5ZUB6_PLEER|nr:hypothetical protein BDN71DRAFT_1449628 [Pleurotus eryngii]
MVGVGASSIESHTHTEGLPLARNGDFRSHLLSFPASTIDHPLVSDKPLRQYVWNNTEQLFLPSSGRCGGDRCITDGASRIDGHTNLVIFSRSIADSLDHEYIAQLHVDLQFSFRPTPAREDGRSWDRRGTPVSGRRCDGNVMFSYRKLSISLH